MSTSGARPAVDIDLEEYERRLRAAVAPSAGVEDPLAELARLVEASHPRGSAGARVGAAPPPSPLRFDAPLAPSQPLPPALEGGEFGRLLGEPVDAPALAAEDDRAAPTHFGATLGANDLEPRRSRGWIFAASALALAGIAMIGGVFVLKGRAPVLQREPPFIAAAEGPTKVQPPSDATVSSSDDSAGNLLKDETQSKRVKVVNNEEQPVDLSAQTSQPPAPVPASPAVENAPTPNPVADALGGAGGQVRGTVDTPVVIGSAPSPAPSPFPEPKPVRTISLRPDGTPIAASAGDAQTPSEPVQPATAATATSADATNAQSSTPKIELPTKLSPPKSAARVVVTKTDTTAPAGAAEAEPAATAPAAKPDKSKAKPQAAAEAAAPAAAPAPTEEAATSGGWAVQLAAPRSEAEAKAAVAKLTEKYASALGGSALGVHKATVNGETVYRVRVSGLSKADAAALCARLKGDGGECFVAK